MKDSLYVLYPKNPYKHTISSVRVGDETFQYFALDKISSDASAAIKRLPFSIRVLLESAIRNCDEFEVLKQDVERILDWEKLQKQSVDIAFKPARVILQDFTGVPVIVDLAAMRNAVESLGGDPNKINPICPVDLVIDHSVDVDIARVPEARAHNEEVEFARNAERFQFLKWGAKAFKNLFICPPGSGIVHQVNLEYLARVVFESEHGFLYPDSVVGTDSHTTMINGLGVLGWGVGGIEAEAVMLDQPNSMVLPEVVGYKLTGKLAPHATATDLVLTITANLRKLGVVNKFVEFFGEGCAGLSISDRATIANMSPEYGATCGFFPVDERTIAYLFQTGRNDRKLAVIEAYCRANHLFRDFRNPSEDPQFSQVIELDLSSVEPSVSGPKRPHDHVTLSNVKSDFQQALGNKVGFKGYGISSDKHEAQSPFSYQQSDYSMKHGDVVLASITSCTNTSNPQVLFAAGLLARNAVHKGLNVKPYIKTSLSPGSRVVTQYLGDSGLQTFLDKLGFSLAGYGCMTCIGNSGPLDENVVGAIEKGDLVAAGVLSGNRNFEGRIHPSTRANYLASPPLVVAFALAGTMNIDFGKDPIGTGSDGQPVFLRDIWPSKEEIIDFERKYVSPEMFDKIYKEIENGNEKWLSLKVDQSVLYPWDQSSTYIKYPPYFDEMKLEVPQMRSIENARVLLNLGDSVTTDHISPAGNIARNSPAARFLGERNVTPRDFNSYGSRRGNDEVMARGTFANIRLVNKFLSKPGARTVFLPTGEEMDIFDAAQRYRDNQIPLLILAGKEYGAGSSRDWAAKGPLLLGIKAVVAEGYERIHRSNLIMMGIMPLQYIDGQNADSLGLTGKEVFTIALNTNLQSRQKVTITTDNGKSFEVLARIDTEVELSYYKHGGIMNFMIRKMMSS